MNKKLLLVIDAQNDFITDALRNEEAIRTLPNLVKLINEHDGTVIATRDTHFSKEQIDNTKWPPANNAIAYEDSLEGQKLPVTHCIKGTEGWQIAPTVLEALEAKNANGMKKFHVIDKLTFGHIDLPQYLKFYDFNEIEICGFVSSICVLANALILRAAYPNMKITVYEDCIADISDEGQNAAITCLRAQQINVETKYELINC